MDRDYLGCMNMIDKELSLILISIEKVTPPDTNVDNFRFTMKNTFSGDEVGSISLKAGYTENIINYRGNIGFAVSEKYRGNHYATRSCKLLIPVIRHLKLNPIYLTCNVDNAALKKSIEMLGANFIGEATVPEKSPYYAYYAEGARIKRRYEWKID